MKFVIKKGSHRAWPLSFGLWFKKKQIRRCVYFDNTCKYHLDGPDMDDTNKILGIGYPWSHKKNSARFGWRYNPATEKITISSYCYDKGVRDINDLCEVSVFKWYHLMIIVKGNQYIFEVRDGVNGWHVIGHGQSVKTHNKKWSYRLGLFFGGNKPAPRDMNIEIKKTIKSYGTKEK